jgi:hypothetical protein
MAELRQREDQIYVDRDIEGVHEGVSFDNDERPVQSLNRPRLVPATNSMTELFSTADVGDLRQRWGNVQTAFVDEPRWAVQDVDEPRWAVQEADKLVATVVDRLTERFANERSSLERQWDSGEEVSTEDLRIALQRYRAFFDRLLNV